VTHFFQSGEGCDAERTNLVSGMKWKKLNKGQETMGMSWKMQHDVWRISVSRQIYLGLYYYSSSSCQTLLENVAWM